MSMDLPYVALTDHLSKYDFQRALTLWLYAIFICVLVYFVFITLEVLGTISWDWVSIDIPIYEGAFMAVLAVYDLPRH